MSLSFLAITIFVFLFFVFIFVKPDPSGNVVASDLVAGMGIAEEFSMVTMILAFVTLIVLLGIIFFVYKKLTKRKHMKKTIKPPIPEVKKDILADMDKGKDLFSDNNKEEPSLEKNVHEENKLMDLQLEPKLEKNLLEKDSVKKDNVEQKSVQKEQKILTNLNQLKKGIIVLLNQRYQRQDILRILESKGWSIEQVVKAIDEINLDSLRAYVKKSLGLGFSKDQIVEYLKRNGWDESLVMKAIQKQ